MRALGLGGKIGYGIGDFGLNLYWQSILLFIVFFHVDMLGLSAWEAGICFFIVGVWDAIMDPLVGMLSDRARGRLFDRMGRYRPFILLGAVPLGLAFTFCFYPPSWLSPGTSGMLAFALISHMLLRSAYSVVGIPYSSLTAAITRDADERASLTGWRMLFAFSGAMTVSAMLPLLAEYFAAGGGGNGYGPAAAITAATATLALLACGAAVRERGRGLVGGDSAPPPLAGFFPAVMRNGPLLRVMAATVLVHVSLGLLMRNLPYLFKYDLGNASLSGIALPWLTAAGVVSVPAWVALAKWRSKRDCWLIGSAMTAVGCLGLPLLHGLWPTLVCLTIIFIGHTAHAVAGWSMLPDAVDFGEWRCRRRDEAKIYGGASCMTKLAVGASGIVSGWALALVGFMPNVEQAAQTVEGFRLLAGLLPSLGMLASMVVIWGYPLDAARHRRIRTFLGRRQPAL